MNILAIDTSTKIMGVAILKNEVIIGEVVTNVKQGQSERLMPAITKLMKDVQLDPSELNQIVVAQGPGSYTGVRIGITTAKSLAWALNIPIIGVSSIDVLAYQGRFFDSIICPFFDARRGNIYTNAYKWENGQFVSLQSEINISMEKWLHQVAQYNKNVLFLSPDIHLYEEVITKQLKELALIPEGPYHFPSPSHLALVSKGKEPSDPHLLTPNYLRLAEAESNWIQAQRKEKSDD